MLKKLENMKVKSRLIFSFMVTVAVASIAGILGAILLLVMDASYSNALVSNGFSQGDIGEYNMYLNKGSALVRDVVMLTNKAEIENAQAQMAECDQLLQEALAEIKKVCTTEEEKAYIAIMEEKYPQYIAVREEVEELGLNNKDVAALATLQKNAIPILNEVTAAAQGLAELNMQLGDKVSNSMSTLSIVMLIVILVVIVVAILASIAFAVYTANAFAKPLVEVKEATQKLVEGDLSIEVKVASANEIGEMANSFDEAVSMLRVYISEIKRGLGEIADGNFDIYPQVEFKGDFVELEQAIGQIAVALSDTMKQINEGAEQVALGAQQMAESAQALAEGATNQAGAVEELTATTENVASAAEDSAHKTDAAYQEAQNFVQVAEGSSKEMEALTVAMERINETSKEIESIISEIEDIASQTNLLSLNASIEAARAGEAGRGFAVVADQIGKLAADSAQSAVNTRELIGKCLEEVEHGNEITNRTAESLGKVIEGIKLLADSAHESSELSAGQAETMNQLQLGIEQISEVVQGNSAAAEQSSATSEELSAQSENLKALVEQFKLRQ